VDFIQTHEVEKCALDLRWNAGGNWGRARHLLRAIIRADKINRRGKLFTIISPQTFSAAVLLAVDLEQHTQTLFVGEPTGGKPNGYGELRRFRLPNSSLEVRYSAWKYQTSSPSDNRPAIMPHLIAGISSSDYRRGIDPALEIILNYKPRQPISEIILDTIRKQGLQPAVRLYQELRNQHYNEYDFSEANLTQLGQELLRSKQVTESIAFFVLNVEAYPYSSNAYYNLAEAYKAAGRNELALKNYRRAFELNKSNTSALENIRTLSKRTR
jgi:tetratricopeptide (TPR) repeat protein